MAAAIMHRVRAATSSVSRRTLLGKHAQYLPLSISGMVALSVSSRLWELHQPRYAAIMFLATALAGLVIQYADSKHWKALGYLLGLGSLGFARAIVTHHQENLSYTLWLMLGGITFPDWRAAPALWGTWLATYFVARWIGGETRVALSDVMTIGTISLVYLGTLFLARESEARAELALTDPLTGSGNRRMLMWRLTEELAQCRRTGGTLAVLYFDLVEFQHLNSLFGYHAGDRALVHATQVFQAQIRAHDLIARVAGDKFVLMAPGLDDASADKVLTRLQAAVIAARFPLPVRLAGGWVIAPRDGSTADELMELVNRGLFEGKQRPRKSGRSLTMQLAEALRVLPDGVQQIVRVLDAEEVELEEHLAQVGRWCLEIARAVGLDDERCQVLSQAAVLHDVGKLALPRALLRKPGRLSPEERALLVRHVTSGVAVLRALGVEEAVLTIIAGHHERWDGAGYPSGAAGEAIPLEARILILADSYDAMISARVYQKGRTVAEAIAEMERQAGRQFDPRLVTALVTLLRVEEQARDRQEGPAAADDAPGHVARETRLIQDASS